MYPLAIRAASVHPADRYAWYEAPAAFAVMVGPLEGDAIAGGGGAGGAAATAGEAGIAGIAAGEEGFGGTCRNCGLGLTGIGGGAATVAVGKGAAGTPVTGAAAGIGTVEAVGVMLAPAGNADCPKPASFASGPKEMRP
jgi:hypothetical protein